MQLLQLRFSTLCQVTLLLLAVYLFSLRRLMGKCLDQFRQQEMPLVKNNDPWPERRGLRNTSPVLVSPKSPGKECAQRPYALVRIEKSYRACNRHLRPGQESVCKASEVVNDTPKTVKKAERLQNEERK